MSFIRTLRNNPCQICGNEDGRCREAGAGLHLCMNLGANDAPSGFRFLSYTKDGLWGKFIESTGDRLDSEEWRRQLEERRQQQREESRRKASMPPTERNHHYQQLLSCLSLHPEDRADLHRRGLSEAQIKAGKFVSVSQWQKLPREFPVTLPGINLDGRSLNTPGDGYLCPIRSVDGLIVGFQLRLRDSEAGGRYRWLSSRTKKRPDGPTAHLQNGENPIAAARPVDRVKRSAIGMCEGILKPFIAAQRLGQVVLGCAGGQFPSSPETLKSTLERLSVELGTIRIEFFPDAGSLLNPAILRQYRAAWELLEQWGYSLQIAWWGQYGEDQPDIDELEDLKAIAFITPAEFLAKGKEPAAPAPAREDSEAIARMVARRIQRRVKRKPDLNIGNREFKEVARDFPKDRDIALLGGKGTGKSEAIAELLKGKSWLSITSLQSLARDQAEPDSWNGAFINDGDVFQNQFLRKGQPVNGGSVCIPSLLKVRQVDADVLVLDEATATLRFLHESSLANKNGIRPLLLEEFARRVREAKQVIIADADLTEEALDYLEKIRGQRSFLVKSERKPLKWVGYGIESRNQAIAELIHRAEHLPAGKLLYGSFDEKSTVEAIAAVLESKGIKCLTITQETSGGEIESGFLSRKGRDIPALIRSGIQAILCSPSVVQGFNIKHNTELVDSIWGIYAGSTIGADAIAQALDRVRAAIPRFIYIPRRGRAYSRLSKALSQDQFIAEFRKSSTSTARLARLSLRPETSRVVDGIDWESENIKLLASFEVERNQGMLSLRDTVRALLQREGKGIKPFAPQLDPIAVKASVDAVKLASRQADEARAQAIADALTLTDDEAAALERKALVQPLDTSELYALEKHWIAKFYRLEEVDKPTVQFDNKRATQQQIRNLESVLNQAIAIGRSAQSIEQNSGTPQDWNRAALRHWLLEDSGAAKLIRGIYQGAISELSSATIQPIAAELKTRADEFKRAFGFSNLDRVSDNQAIATVLDWCGIKRVSERRRVNGKPTRIYFVNAAHLNELKSIIERRSKADPPPQTSNSVWGGGSPYDADEWSDPECLADVREWLSIAAECPEIESMLALVPIHIRERALAA